MVLSSFNVDFELTLEFKIGVDSKIKVVAGYKGHLSNLFADLQLVTSFLID